MFVGEFLWVYDGCGAFVDFLCVGVGCDELDAFFDSMHCCVFPALFRFPLLVFGWLWPFVVLGFVVVGEFIPLFRWGRWLDGRRRDDGGDYRCGFVE